MIDEAAICTRYLAIKDRLDGRGRRLFVAAGKLAVGYGGTVAVSRATGVAHSTIIRGARELRTTPVALDRVRRKGAGRPALSQSNPAVLEDLRRLVEPATMGDPMRRPLPRVSKSRMKLAAALRGLNHSVSANTVGKMLPILGYSRQVNGKTKEGSHHADRDRQFQHINRQVLALQTEFAVNAVRRWHQVVGSVHYPEVDRLLITADGGGSNGSRVRLWKLELQKLADATGLAIQVCHYPPGTSKWNKIEHRMFSQNWRAKPLVSGLAVLDLIAATTTTTGLTVRYEPDEKTSAKGIKVTDAEMATLNIESDVWHPKWNYTIKPRSTGRSGNS